MKGPERVNIFNGVSRAVFLRLYHVTKRRIYRTGIPIKKIKNSLWSGEEALWISWVKRCFDQLVTSQTLNRGS